MPRCRLIVDPQPRTGAWNMAVDEALLQSAVERGDLSVRTYTWSDATVSLGYFQSADAIASNARFAGLAAVRRLSGGGAIVHHHEITYSCALPAHHPLARDPSKLYASVHSAIIRLLAESGLPSRLRGGGAGKAGDVFLCFGRGDPNDILLEGHKIVGSAQRRRRGAVLQHGALLLRRSEFAPDYPGLLNLIPSDIPVRELDLHLGERIAAALIDDWSPGKLSPRECSLAEELESRKYNRLTWRI